MSLPFIPGYATNETSPKKGNKTQTLVYKNGYAVPKTVATSGVFYGTSTLPSDTIITTEPIYDPQLTYTATKKDYSFATSKFPAQIKPQVKAQKPPHQVLSFDAYYTESVPYSAIEKERPRIVQINYFLEDDTIMIKEKRSANSGLPQGMILKRQKVPSAQEGFITLDDFNLGINLDIYGKRYRITDCDYFTKNYLNDHGVELGNAEMLPSENYAEQRKVIENPPRTYKSNPNKEQLKKFLEMDGQVLRFYCSWDNRENMFGEKRNYILHYFLVDDTVEVREVQTQNSGHHPFSVFLKRQKLPKKDEKNQFMSPKDFKVGEYATVFGRNFFIYDSDVFTTRYYKDKFGITFEPIAFNEEQDEADLGTKSRYNITKMDNSEEVKNKKRFIKLLNNDGKILRFSATLESARPEDKERIFVASYYLADDTIGIYEPPQRNSGIIGGKFLERKQVLNPQTGQNYVASDFFIGAVIEVFSRRFILHDADEYAYNYMESNPADFPMSNIDAIHERIKEISRQNGQELEDLFANLDVDGNGFISLEEFRNAVIDAGFDLTEQEIITLVRKYDLNGDSRISYPELVAALK